MHQNLNIRKSKIFYGETCEMQAKTIKMVSSFINQAPKLQFYLIFNHKNQTGQKKIRNSKLLGISELVRNIVWSPTLRFHNERKKSNMEICIQSRKSSIFTNENQINYIRSGKKITWWSHDVAVTNAFWARKRIILFVRRFSVWNPENAIISCRLPLFLLPTS